MGKNNQKSSSTGTIAIITDRSLKEAYELLTTEKCNAVFPVAQLSFPPQRGLILENGTMLPISPMDYMKRSQDLQPVYHDSGQFYFFNAASGS